MSPEEAYQLLLELFEGRAQSWEVRNLLACEPLTGEEMAAISGAVERLVIEGEAPVEAMRALRIVNEQNHSSYQHNKAVFRHEIARCGTWPVVKALEARLKEIQAESGEWRDGGILSAFNDANDELKRDLRNVVMGPTRVLIRNPRARESRPRAARSSRSRDRPRPSGDDDPDLAPGGTAA
jgi:hypothetical protein